MTLDVTILPSDVPNSSLSCRKLQLSLISCRSMLLLLLPAWCVAHTNNESQNWRRNDKIKTATFTVTRCTFSYYSALLSSGDLLWCIGHFISFSGSFSPLSEGAGVWWTVQKAVLGMLMSACLLMHLFDVDVSRVGSVWTHNMKYRRTFAQEVEFVNEGNLKLTSFTKCWHEQSSQKCILWPMLKITLKTERI